MLRSRAVHASERRHTCKAPSAREFLKIFHGFAYLALAF
jgi:hypothetical protein